MATPRNKGGVSLWRAGRWPALAGAPLLLLSLLFAPAVQAANLEELDSIVAVVNKDVIVRSELDREIVLALPEMREKGAEMPARAELERKVLERMIEKRLQMQEAQRVGIKVDDGALTQAMEGIAQRNNLTLEELQTALGGQRHPLRGLPRGYPLPDDHEPAAGAGSHQEHHRHRSRDQALSSPRESTA
jgi:peptidyl-prolyl cis-trans isomerase SurA